MARFNKKARRVQKGKNTEPIKYVNTYFCKSCQIGWNDAWSCMCNDRCPSCNKETEPYYSYELTKAPLLQRVESPTGLVHVCTKAAPPGSYKNVYSSYSTLCNGGGYIQFTYWRRWSLTDKPITCKKCLDMLHKRKKDLDKPKPIKNEVSDRSIHTKVMCENSFCKFNFDGVCSKDTIKLVNTNSSDLSHLNELACIQFEIKEDECI